MTIEHQGWSRPYLDEVSKAGLDGVIWQAFAALLPVQGGVIGDERTYDHALA